MRAAGALLAAALLAGACSGSAPSSSPSAAYRVVASTSMFADLARMALGTAANVDSIAPAGVDVHTFEPSPRDAQRLAGADLVLVNGLGLDGWMAPLVEASRVDATRVVALGEGLEPLGWTYIAAGQGENPHVWLDPAGATLYVRRIAERAAAAMPDRAEEIAATSGAAIAEIAKLDAGVRAAFDRVAVKRIVTFHDAFPYYARAYGIEVVGVAVDAPGQEPSARETAALIEAIRAAGVTTIFSEEQFPTALVERIADETGATVIANLHSDSLGRPPADTYVGAMRENASLILGALGGSLP